LALLMVMRRPSDPQKHRRGGFGPYCPSLDRSLFDEAVLLT
jgi:hypothetical protein